MMLASEQKSSPNHSLTGSTTINLNEPLSFDKIYLQGRIQRGPGKFKLAPGGLGWKEASTGQVITVPATDFAALQWERGWQGQQLRILHRDGSLYAFDNFPGEALDGLREFSQHHYGIKLEERESSLKGWNWGEVSIDGKELEFRDSENKLTMSLPLGEVINCTSATRDEIALEFAQPETQDKKTDTLVEIRFHIPPHAQRTKLGRKSSKQKVEKKPKNKSGEAPETSESPASDESLASAESEASLSSDEVEAIEPAKALAEKIKGLTQMHQMMGDVIASLPNLPCVVPRGRFDLEMGNNHLRLHGKSYDHRILYSSIIKAFLLPKNDDMHVLLVLALDPPLRQGQTRYPFVLFQFNKDEELSIDLQNVDETILRDRYEGKLQAHYEPMPIFELVSNLFRHLAGQKIIVPGSFQGQDGGHSVKCVFKANEGQLYPLERNFLFLPKPVTLLPHSDIAQVEFSRVGGERGGTLGGNPRTFDLKFYLKNGQEVALNNILKEEHQTLEEFIKAKGIETRRKEEDRRTKRKTYKEDEEDEDESGDEKNKRRRRYDRDEKDEEEDEESSPDEDYQEGESEEESEIDEEYDEDYESDSNADIEEEEVEEEEEEEEENDDE